MKALGVREGPGSVRRDWAGPGPGLGRHLGCWGWATGPDSPGGFGSEAQSLGWVRDAHAAVLVLVSQL